LIVIPKGKLYPGAVEGIESNPTSQQSLAYAEVMDWHTVSAELYHVNSTVFYHEPLEPMDDLTISVISGSKHQLEQRTRNAVL
jgi:hypothetical protein